MNAPMDREFNGLFESELETALQEMGEPPYRGRQVARWLHGRGARAFAEMTDLPRPLRERLGREARLALAEPVRRVRSADGATVKYLLRLPDGESIEAVFMRYDDGRRSVCLSTQVGCAMGCTFCATGLMGLTRNLSAGEIVDQVQVLQREEGERVTNVVFMGMGEPLANYAAAVRAARLLNAPYGLAIGMRHLTVSTVGLVPGIRRLAREGLPLTLAVSLHAPNDALRSSLVPLNATYPLADLMAACREYVEATGRRLTFEYVLIDGVNDAAGHARELRDLLGTLPRARRGGVLAHVNLIPWNPVAGMSYRRPPVERVRAFARVIGDGGISTTVRIERGVEIEAACGQLRVEHERGRRARIPAAAGVQP